MKIARDIVRPTLALIIICAFISGVVSIVYNITKVEKVEGMSEEALIVATDVMGTDKLSLVSNKSFPDTVTGAAVAEDGSYVLSVVAKGYGGDMELVVGFNTDDTIKGVAFVSASETPGIGTKVTESGDLIDQFIGLSGEIVINEDVDAISGATISSKAVVEAVNIATENLELAKNGTIAEGEG